MALADRPLSGGCEMTGHVRGGVFYVDDKRTLARRIGTLPDGPAVMRIEPAAGARTLADNRRYFAILAQISKQSGNSQEEMHEHYKKKFNFGKSTTVLSEDRFRLYVDMVMGDAAAEWGIEFPLPEALVSA